MYSLLTIIGARPQIIKAAALSRVLRTKYSDTIREYIVHTGQHYDENMSDIFFRQMQIPSPELNLNIGSASHGEQTGKMLEKLEHVILQLKPNAVLVYGDTNSTLAGALAAAKLRVPLIHVEAGLRSFNKSMPEEINRIVADHCSTLLFAPTQTAIHNLKKEGFKTDSSQPYSPDNPGVFHSGDIMLDNSLYFAKTAEKNYRLPEGINKNKFILCTIHRDSNTDNPERLSQIFEGLLKIIETFSLPVVLPLHPRTKKNLESLPDKNIYREITNHSGLRIIPPVGYLEMCLLEKYCSLVITDSGGVQKESYFFKKPCVVLRKETEWTELLKERTAILTDNDPKKMVRATAKFLKHPPEKFPPVFGKGKTAEFIAKKILMFFKNGRKF
jgi:UDP-GlcNAc3NAcA epimerase